MKKALFLITLMCLPMLCFAKYCPTCFETFQEHTTKGRANLLYRSLITVLNPKNPIKYKNFELLFDKDVTIIINGNRTAQGLPAAYRYFIRLRQQRPLLESKLGNIIVGHREAAIEYQIITRYRGHKNRSLVIAILNFKAHKLYRWYSISHTTKAE